MVGTRMLVGVAVVAAATGGGLAMTASPALAKVGPPITVVTTDAPPPGGKATFDPATRRLTVCDNERNVFAAVARVRIARMLPREVPVSNACRGLVQQIPPNTEVALQVCLSPAATGGGRLLSCSEWKATRT
jgi:hypothetical protein